MLIDKVKFYAMRSVRNKTLRNAMTKLVSSNIREILNFDVKESKYIKPNNIDSHVSNLENNGFTELDEQLSNEIIDNIIDHSKTLKCFDPFHRDLGFFDIEDVTETTHVANFQREDLIRNEVIMKIANDPGILSVVNKFLNAKPTISNVNMWWSLGGRKQAKDAQLFHRDMDDFKFCKLFVYLTDVTENHGPHTYVKGSSSSPKLRKIRRYQDSEIEEAFGKENILKFVRPKGSVFIVNTYGFHKGTLPTKGNRLLLQIQYSLFPIGIENYQPIEVEGENNFNPYINRLLIK
jgi:hypothetical protein